MAKKTEEAKERAVLVTTQYRGVFMGFIPFDAKVKDGELKLTRARCCVYWPAECKGFLGLATVGPIAGAKIGPAADCTLYGVTCVAEVSPEAVAQWEKSPWR